MAKFGPVEAALLTQGLSDTQRAVFQSQYQNERKDPGTCVILAIFWFDRFWLGDIGLGILKYITFGGCGIWGLVDIFTAAERCHEYNAAKAAEIVQAIKLTLPSAS